MPPPRRQLCPVRHLCLLFPSLTPQKPPPKLGHHISCTGASGDVCVLWNASGIYSGFSKLVERCAQDCLLLDSFIAAAGLPRGRLLCEGTCKLGHSNGSAVTGFTRPHGQAAGEPDPRQPVGRSSNRRASGPSPEGAVGGKTAAPCSPADEVQEPRFRPGRSRRRQPEGGLA